MGITPPASALAHVALIQNPATRPPPLIPITQTPAHIPASSLQLNTQPNPFLATALPTQAASLQPQMGACPALPLEANAASLLMGTGTCPLPEPIRKKILNLEYIDMADLRPDAWLVPSDPDGDCTLQKFFRRRKQPVTDFTMWVQCYSSMVTVLVEAYPQYINHLLAYLSTIASKSSNSSLNWVAYDSAYRRKAASIKSLCWGIIDVTLYATWFSSHGQEPSCSHCLSAEHTSSYCPSTPFLGQCYEPPAWTPVPHVQKAAATQSLAAVIPQAAISHGREPCGKFNARGGPNCPHNPCRYDHRCKSCEGPHPASHCPHIQRKRPPLQFQQHMPLAKFRKPYGSF